MRRLLSALLAITLMITMTVPCYATQVQPYAMTTTTGTDKDGNVYRIVCESTISYDICAAYTDLFHSSYGSGATMAYADIEHVVSVYGTVYFYDGSYPDTSIFASAPMKDGARTSSAYDYHDYDKNTFVSMNGDHYATSNNGLSIHITSVELPE